MKKVSSFLSCLRFLMFLGFKKKLPSENFGNKTWPPNFQVWGIVLQPVVGTSSHERNETKALTGNENVSFAALLLVVYVNEMDQMMDLNMILMFDSKYDLFHVKLENLHF